MESGDLFNILDNETAVIGIIMTIVILLVAYSIIRKIRDGKLLKKVTSKDRGTKSERDLVLSLLKYGIPHQTIFHDLYVETEKGKFSQIDVVLATTQGIIVIEVKDFSGWIFGNGNHSHWTKVLAYGKRKYRFYNPIKQNNGHIKALKSQLSQFKNIPFYSLILFSGDCELKEINFVPAGTYLIKSSRLFEVLELIKITNKPAPYTDKHEVVRLLQSAVGNGDLCINREMHNQAIKDMLGKDRIFD